MIATIEMDFLRSASVMTVSKFDFFAGIHSSCLMKLNHNSLYHWPLLGVGNADLQPFILGVDFDDLSLP